MSTICRFTALIAFEVSNVNQKVRSYLLFSQSIRSEHFPTRMLFCDFLNDFVFSLRPARPLWFDLVVRMASSPYTILGLARVLFYVSAGIVLYCVILYSYIVS